MPYEHGNEEEYEFTRVKERSGEVEATKRVLQDLAPAQKTLIQYATLLVKSSVASPVDVLGAELMFAHGSVLLYVIAKTASTV